MMTSKKGSNVNQASAANVTSAPPKLLGSASTRGNMSAKGAVAAKQFLSARWRAVEATARDASLNANGESLKFPQLAMKCSQILLLDNVEKPEIHQEKTPSIGVGQHLKQGGQQVKTGSAWGRRK